MTATSRKSARDALYTLLNSAMVGAGKPCTAVFNADASDFLNAAPCMVLRTIGSQRGQRLLDSTKGQNRFAFAVEVYVPDASAKAGESWSDTAAQDSLDTIEAALADVVLANRRGAYWLNLQWDDTYSQIDPIAEAGRGYLREVIGLVAWVYDT